MHEFPRCWMFCKLHVILDEINKENFYFSESSLSNISHQSTEKTSSGIQVKKEVTENSSTQPGTRDNLHIYFDDSTCYSTLRYLQAGNKKSLLCIQSKCFQYQSDGVINISRGKSSV